MSPTDAVKLTGYIQALFPQQPINEYTPDVLGDVLADFAFEDCKAAVMRLATRVFGEGNNRDGKKWCAPTEVYAEVRRLREDRINDEVIDMPPGLDPDDTAAYARALAEGRRRLASGQPPAPRGDLPTRDVSALGTAGQPIDHDHRSAARAAMQDGKAAAKANEVPVPRRFPVTAWHGPNLKPKEANA